MRGVARSSQQSGFTLVELIIVIVITGIIAVGSTQFIVNAVRGMQDISRRAALANVVTISGEKIERQLRSSAASSIRVAKNQRSQCVEMLPIKTTAFYLNGSGTKQLKVVSLQGDVVGMHALSDSNSNALATQLSNVVNAQLPGQDGKITTLTLSQPFLYSQSKQQLVHFVTTPVSYCIEGDKLYKYSRYRWSKKQRLPAKLPKKEPYKVLVGQGFLTESEFRFNQQSKRFDLVLSAGDENEKLTINQLLSLAYE